MKKINTILFAVAMAATAFAAKKESQDVTLNSKTSIETVVLKSEKFKTESEEVYVHDTCSRQVADGSDYVCHDRPSYDCSGSTRDCEIVTDCDSSGCHPIRVCSSVPDCSWSSVPDCGWETTYRTEWYDCSYYKTRYWEVKVHDTVSKINLHLDAVPAGLEFSEKVRAEVNNDIVSITSSTKKSKVLLFSEIDSKESMVSGVNHIEANVKVSVERQETLLAPLAKAPKITKASDGKFVVSINGLVKPEWYDLKVTLKKSRFLAKAKVFGSATFSVDNMVASVTGDTTDLQFTDSDMGFSWNDLEKGTYKLEVKLVSKMDQSNLINKASLPEKLEISSKASVKKK